jgi:hypothetical protein
MLDVEQAVNLICIQLRLNSNILPQKLFQDRILNWISNLKCPLFFKFEISVNFLIISHQNFPTEKMGSKNNKTATPKYFEIYSHENKSDLWMRWWLFLGCIVKVEEI